MAEIEVNMIYRWRCDHCGVLGWAGTKQTSDQELVQHYDVDHGPIGIVQIETQSWREHVYSIRRAA